MSFGWPPYVPVAKRREQAAKKINRLRKQGVDIQPVTIDGRKITRTFWGNAWCEHIESFSDYDNRLPRGRTYVRNGSVCHLELRKGKITGIVSGSKLYKIRGKIKVLSEQRWQQIKSLCAGQIGSILELLQGKLSDNIMGVVTDSQQGLFPSEEEIELSCNCPDWAHLCKHLAAILYGIGARLDQSPELLFALRGIDHKELISTDIEIPSAGKRRRVTGNLTDVFGVDLSQTTEPATATSNEQASGLKRPTKTIRTGKMAAATQHKKFQATGSAVRQLREQLQMSKAEFAQLLDVSVTSISNWESKQGKLALQHKSAAALTLVSGLSFNAAWQKLQE